MPRFNIANTGTSRLQIRDDARGLVPLMPGTSGDFDLPLSLARYYAGAGANVDPDPNAEGGAKGGGGDGKKSLADLSGAERQKIVEAERIDLGDTDIESDEAVAIIAAFRRIYESGTEQLLRDSSDYADVDFSGAKSKYEVVNAIIAAKGVAA